MNTYSISLEERIYSLDAIVSITEHINVNELSLKKQAKYFELTFVTPLAFIDVKLFLKEDLSWDYDETVLKTLKEKTNKNTCKGCTSMVKKKPHLVALEEIEAKIASIQKQQSFYNKNPELNNKDSSSLTEIYQSQLTSLLETKKSIVKQIEVEYAEVLDPVKNGTT